MTATLRIIKPARFPFRAKGCKHRYKDQQQFGKYTNTKQKAEKTKTEKDI